MLKNTKQRSTKMKFLIEQVVLKTYLDLQYKNLQKYHQILKNLIKVFRQLSRQIRKRKKDQVQIRNQNTIIRSSSQRKLKSKKKKRKSSKKKLKITTKIKKNQKTKPVKGQVKDHLHQISLKKVVLVQEDHPVHHPGPVVLQA